MTAVVLSRCESYEVSRICDLLEDSLSQLPPLVQLHPGARVLVKPNLLMKRDPERHTTTHPAVVEAVVRVLQARGCLVTLADSPGGPFTDGMLPGLYAVTGMQEVARRTGAHLNDSLEGTQVEVPNPVRSHLLTVLRCAAEADCIVSVGKIKTHGLTAYTGAVKNLFGLIPGLLKVDCHARFPDIDDFSDALLDLAAWASPCLSVLDGIVGMEGKGPSGGTPRSIGALVVSEDPHAADVVGAALIGLEPEGVSTLRAAARRGCLPVPLVLGESVADLAVPNFVKAPVEGKTRLLTHPVFSHLVRSHPYVRKKLCAGCGLCARSCPGKAIELRDGLPHFDLKKCIRCYCCQELCLKNAVDVRQPFFMKLLP